MAMVLMELYRFVRELVLLQEPNLPFIHLFFFFLMYFFHLPSFLTMKAVTMKLVLAGFHTDCGHDLDWRLIDAVLGGRDALLLLAHMLSHFYFFLSIS